MYLSEHVTGLLCDPDEGGPSAELFELSGAHIGACGPKTSENIMDSVVHISSVRDLHRPPFRCSAGQRRARGDKDKKIAKTRTE